MPTLSMEFRKLIECYYRGKGLTAHKVVVLYLKEAHSEAVKLSFEHRGYVWLLILMARSRAK